MGGPRRTRITRPTALVSAVATLFAALFICLGPGPGPADAHHRPDSAAGATAAGSRAPHVQHVRAEQVRAEHVRAEQVRAEQVRAEQVRAEDRFSCPYDNGDCGFFPHLSPAVLTVPPPAAPLTGGVQLQHLEPPHPTGQVPRSGALARAPDLHVLQVLRT
ncbi:hypothetical protein [Streptomyces sp. NPDC058280]|uniref:hypothetical protein n=1 Tax=Streptomyces sp. NPDC058280 TaxID=3346419 RepID=UPI0036DFD23E